MARLRMTFPRAHWRQIRSTNPRERLNKEIRRRTDVVGIFPSDESVLRLVTMRLCDQSDEWCVGRRYFGQESMKLLAAAEPELLASRTPFPIERRGPFRPPSRYPLDPGGLRPPRPPPRREPWSSLTKPTMTFVHHLTGRYWPPCLA